MKPSTKPAEAARKSADRGFEATHEVAVVAARDNSVRAFAYRPSIASAA
jgi:hypothetical protein